jgi:hypothetical protein
LGGVALASVEWLHTRHVNMKHSLRRRRRRRRRRRGGGGGGGRKKRR